MQGDSTEAELTDLGKEQARRVSAALSNIKFDRCTLRLRLSALRLRLSSGLRSPKAGLCSTTSMPSLPHRHPRAHSCWTACSTAALTCSVADQPALLTDTCRMLSTRQLPSNSAENPCGVHLLDLLMLSAGSPKEASFGGAAASPAPSRGPSPLQSWCGGIGRGRRRTCSPLKKPTSAGSRAWRTVRPSLALSRLFWLVGRSASPRPSTSHGGGGGWEGGIGDCDGRTRSCSADSLRRMLFPATSRLQPPAARRCLAARTCSGSSTSRAAFKEGLGLSGSG